MQNLRAFYFKLRSICIGWWRFLFAKRSEMAKKRVFLCKGCQFKKGYFCSVCWCEIHAKAEVEDEKCPMGYW